MNELEQVQNRLANSAYFEIRQIKCMLKDGNTLVLYGKVSSFYMKQQAQEMVRHYVVNNEIEVEKE